MVPDPGDGDQDAALKRVQTLSRKYSMVWRRPVSNSTLRFPAEQFFGRARYSGRRCLGSSTGSGFVDDLALAAGEFGDELGEIEDGELGRVADVDGLVEIGLGEAVDAVDEVADSSRSCGSVGLRRTR